MSAALDFAGRHVLVTGGAQGIGAAIVQCFAESGAEVVIADIDIDQATQLAETLNAAGAKARAVHVDLADRASIQRLMADCPQLDVLIHNAGYFPLTPLREITPERLERTLAVNPSSLFWLTQAALPLFEARCGGQILVTSSVTGNRVAYPGLIHYAASKSGVNGFIRNAALELASANVRVNGVEPGIIRTPATENLGDAAHAKNIARTIPLGYMGDGDDIANAMLFLAADMARYITGQTIVVDGGATLPETGAAL